MPFYKDLADLPEDRRIEIIGRYVRINKKPVAFVVETGGSDEGKGDRYLKKLLDKFPDLKLISRFPGPIRNTELIKVELK